MVIFIFGIKNCGGVWYIICCLVLELLKKVYCWIIRILVGVNFWVVFWKILGFVKKVVDFDGFRMVYKSYFWIYVVLIFFVFYCKKVKFFVFY